MKSHRLRGLAAAVALVAAGAAHTATINTVPAWNGVDEINDFSPSVTQTYGQTITAAGDDSALLSFTFHFKLTGGPAFPMRGKVYRWNPGTSRAIGAPLFDSAPVTLTGVGFQPYTFNIPGGVPVTPGQMYVMFVTVSQDLPLPAASSSTRTTERTPRRGPGRPGTRWGVGRRGTLPSWRRLPRRRPRRLCLQWALGHSSFWRPRSPLPAGKPGGARTLR